MFKTSWKWGRWKRNLQHLFELWLHNNSFRSVVMHIMLLGSNAEATETYSLSHNQHEPTSLAVRNRCPTEYLRNWHMASSRVPLSNCMDNRDDSDRFRAATSIRSFRARAESSSLSQSLQFADVSFMYTITQLAENSMQTVATSWYIKPRVRCHIRPAANTCRVVFRRQSYPTVITQAETSTRPHQYRPW